MNSAFSDVYRHLSALNPFWFFGAYLLVFVGYGLIYDNVAAHEFYAPFARFEPGANSDKERLIDTLETSLRRSLQTRTSAQLVAGDWKVEPNSVQVDGVRSADGTDLQFQIRVSALGIKEFAGGRSYGWSIDVRIPDSPSMVVYGRDPVTYRIAEPDYSHGASVPITNDKKALYYLLFGWNDPAHGPSIPGLRLNADEERQLASYFRGMKGDASSISDHASRMIYLSAQTITTLGLGDIVPLTPRARILVASEALFGVLLVGLFLNAVAYRASRN